MKSLKIFACLSLVLCMLYSCGGSKEAVADKTRTKILLDECQELAQKKPEVRSWGEAINFSLSSAANYAELQARARFARAISAKIKTAEENSGLAYRKSSTNTVDGATVRDEGANQNEMQLSIAESVIKNAVVIKTTQYMMPDGSYQVFVCLEYREGVEKLADEIAKQVKQQVSDEDRMKMQYEFEKFRERIEEELRKGNTSDV